MARESFEDLEIADILNKYYVSVKVDKEERPDIDSIYMAVCHREGRLACQHLYDRRAETILRWDLFS